MWNTRDLSRLALPVIVIALLTVTSCSQSRKLASSGNADVDQTAEFLASVIDEQRDNQRFENSTELAAWLTSAGGVAEWVPPSIEYEEDAAEMYTGLRPAQTVGIWKEPWDTAAFDYYILVSADSDEDVIVLRAYNMGDSKPFFSWEI